MQELKNNWVKIIGFVFVLGTIYAGTKAQINDLNEKIASTEQRLVTFQEFKEASIQFQAVTTTKLDAIMSSLARIDKKL
jgi:hypothetical protein